MRAIDIYIDKQVRGEEVEPEFPKNESSWEELFNFGLARIVDIVKIKKEAIENAAQQSVQLTALRRGLALSIFINVVLLAVVSFIIGGN